MITDVAIWAATVGQLARLEAVGRLLGKMIGAGGPGRGETGGYAKFRFGEIERKSSHPGSVESPLRIHR
jgi:hypothetical protein